MKKRQKWAEWLSCAALCALAFWVIYRFAQGTTPLRKDEYCWDSGLFQVVGKLWADGLCPYVDIFDHKGPLLFFIQKIAYHFANPRVALYVLESLFVSAALICAYRALRLALKSGWAFLGSVVMLAFWLPLMEYGNLCETYSMPFLMLSLWLQMRYFQGKSRQHPCRFAFVYGVCFGANLMIRPNNGMLIAVITLVITLQLAVLGEWKNIGQNALALIAGVLLPVVPFVAYFALRGALAEFIYATWTFNLIYAQSLEFLLDWQSIRNVLWFITPALMCMGIGGCCCFQRKWTLGIVNVLSAVATVAITMSGIGYAHYFMLYVPLVPLALVSAGWLAPKGRGWKVLMAMACVLFALCTIRTTLPVAKAAWVSPPTAQEAAQEKAYDDMVQALIAPIPPQERSRVAVCGLLVTDAELFLKTDLHPVGRYCFLMEWHSRADNSIRQRFMQTLQSGEAKWVIYREGGAGEDILKILDNHYELVQMQEYPDADYFLYRYQQ